MPIVTVARGVPINPVGLGHSASRDEAHRTNDDSYRACQPDDTTQGSKLDHAAPLLALCPARQRGLKPIDLDSPVSQICTLIADTIHYTPL